MPRGPQPKQQPETSDGRVTSASSVNDSDQPQRKHTRLPHIGSSAAISNETKATPEQRKSPYRIPPSLLLLAGKKSNASKHKKKPKAT